MQIGRKDLMWNYAATAMRILSGVIVLPVTLRMFPSEEMGLWSIFLSLTTITGLLDFGFSNSFSRNITYIFSGIKELKTSGYAAVETQDIDYGLLKSMLNAMKRLYGIVAVVFLVLFVVVGSIYLKFFVLDGYSGNHQNVWFAWILFGIVLAYELYTYYYYAILSGRGKIKQSMQITILSQSVRIIVTITLLILGLRLLALVIGMLVGDLIARTMMFRLFYDKETQKNLTIASPSISTTEVLKTIAPNSVKLGFTVLGVFLRSKAIVLIAPVYLSLSEIAQFGISKQIVDLIYSLSITWFSTFVPQFSQYSVRNQKDDTKRLYLKAIIITFAIFVAVGVPFILFGDTILVLIKSKTFLLSGSYLLLMLIFSFLEANQWISSYILLARNEVPFYKSNIISGVLTVALLWIMLKFTSLGVLSLIFSAGIAMCVYVNWKWPLVTIRDLKIMPKDYIIVMKSFFKQNKYVK
jgi:O-antigen/teichoic acid export membrane protein